LRYRCREAGAAALGTTVILGFILIATGATLGVRGHAAQTAEEAARPRRRRPTARAERAAGSPTPSHGLHDHHRRRGAGLARGCRRSGNTGRRAVGPRQRHRRIATPVGMIAMMMLSRDRRVMGDGTIGGRLYAAGWIVTVAITVLSLMYLVEQFTG
jgi:hypothetical protein